MIQQLKSLLKSRNLDTWRSTLLFYKFNPHSIPGVCDFLCKLGRHDYEVTKVTSKKDITLECFYCYKQKRSLR